MGTTGSAFESAFDSDDGDYYDFDYGIVTYEISSDSDAELSEETDDTTQLETTPETVGGVRPLFLQAADVIGARFSFEAVELWSQRLGKGMTDEVQLAVMKASFPVDKELIRHYAYLSRKVNVKNAFADLIHGRKRGKTRLTVSKILQIGFTLTRTVVESTRYCDDEKKEIQVAVSVDRRRITSMFCSAHPNCAWCKHVIELTFYRMDHPYKVQYRLPLSDSVQRLSESEQKQFINILLSRCPLDILAMAQDTLDNIFTQKHSRIAIGGDVANSNTVEVPDRTAGGGVDDDGLWVVEVEDIRQIVSDYCLHSYIVGRDISIGDYEDSCSSTWLSAFQTIRRRIAKEKTTFVIDKLLRAELKGLGMILQLTTDLLKKGEQSAVAALSAVTEQWLEISAQRACDTNVNGQNSSGIGENDHSFIANIPTLAGERSQYPKNIELLCTNSPWCLPDQIAVCWRTAVFASAFNDDVVDCIKSKLLTWSRQLDQVVAAGLDLVHKSDNSSRYQSPDKPLWRSLSGWNGFEHVAALANKTLRPAFSLLSSTFVGFATSLVVPHDFMSKRAEVLNTAAYFVLCLLDNGMDMAAKGLAKLCFTAILSISVVEFFDKEAGNEDEKIEDSQGSVSDILSAIAQCHEELSSSLWGDQSGKNLAMALIVLFKVIEDENWAWSSKRTYNLRPWLRQLVGGSFLQMLVDDSEDPVNLVSSPGMFFGLICVLTSTKGTSPPLMEQGPNRLSSCKQRSVGHPLTQTTTTDRHFASNFWHRKSFVFCPNPVCFNKSSSCS